MGAEGSPALDRLLEAVFERGLVISPVKGHGYRPPSYSVKIGPPVEEETEEDDSRPAGRIGGLGG